jgi:hypothetical protein
MNYTTKREAFTELIRELFEYIGVEPFIGFTFILAVYMLYRLISLYKVIRYKKDYDFYDKAYDLILIFTIIMWWLIHQDKILKL